MQVQVLVLLPGEERGLLHCGCQETGHCVTQFSTSEALNLSAAMASHGDTAEGGANEEFNDIIKWRSGMFESVGSSNMRCRHIAQRCD